MAHLRNHQIPQVEDSECSSDAPDATTCCSNATSTEWELASDSAGTSAASWTPRSSGKFHSPAEAAHVLMVASGLSLAKGGDGQRPCCGGAVASSSNSTASNGNANGNSTACNSTAGNSTATSSAASARISMDRAESIAGLTWVPLPIAEGSMASRASEMRAASKAQARLALQATLQQIVELPYKEFLRAAGPQFNVGGSPCDAADVNFGYLGDSPAPKVRESWLHCQAQDPSAPGCCDLLI